MPTHSINTSVSTGANTRSSSYEITADGSATREVPIGNAASDFQVDVNIDMSEMKSFLLKADVGMTVKTNSSGTPDDTFTLKAGVPLLWTENSYFSNPLSADVTALYVTNDQGESGELVVEALEDSTPSSTSSSSSSSA